MHKLLTWLAAAGVAAALAGCGGEDQPKPEDVAPKTHLGTGSSDPSALDPPAPPKPEAPKPNDGATD